LGLEDRRVLHARVNRVRIGERRLEAPDALELPRMLRAVVPLVRAGRAVVDELVSDGLPRLAAVARALHDLPEPAARLRRVEPAGIGGRAAEVIHLPAGEVRAGDVPLLALAIRGQDEGALLGAHEYANATHAMLLEPVMFEAK